MTYMCRKRTFLTSFSLDSACPSLSFSFRSLQDSHEITTSPAFSPGLFCGCRWVLRRALPGLWDRVVHSAPSRAAWVWGSPRVARHPQGTPSHSPMSMETSPDQCQRFYFLVSISEIFLTNW